MSVSTEPKTRIDLSLDDLVVLCNEMVALARAGVPLDRGLVQLGRDLPGRLAAHATSIGQRLEAGESLADVVGGEGAFPPVYRAVVEAGLRSGRLTSSLESFSVLARHAVEMRRIVALALVYPLFILVLVGVLSWLVLSRWGPSLASAQSLQRAQPGPAFERVQHWLTPVGNWLWVVPLALSVIMVAWWYGARRSAAAEPLWFARTLGWVPGAGRLLRLSRVATFAEVLALLVEQCVPMDQGLLLAAGASGDAGLDHDARQLAMCLRQGQSSLTGAGRPRNGIPPLLRWSLAYDHQRAGLAGALRQTARTYRRRAEDAAEWLQVYLPVILTAGIGGTATMIYVACVMVPWYWFLESMPFTQGPF